ncbi:MAG: hypothetical protein ABIG91_03270 [Patescibacteria group bacterium]
MSPYLVSGFVLMSFKEFPLKKETPLSVFLGIFEFALERYICYSN